MRGTPQDEGWRENARLSAVLGPWISLALAVIATGQEPQVGDSTQVDDPATLVESSPGPIEAPRAHYDRLEDAGEIEARWLASGLAERLELGASAGGRKLTAIQFGGRGARPLAERATVVLVGGLDGRSLSGCQAVIAVVDALLGAPDRLPPEVGFLAIPWANPDGLARTAAGRACDGLNDRPIDDDGDGAVDEDGPDDLDGDGLLLELLVEDPLGALVRHSDPRFVRQGEAGEGPRYRLLAEGKDDDGDGRLNEDGTGGVDLDANFPFDWQGSWAGVASGASPLSEQETRAIAVLLSARPTVIALLFQGNHGELALPGGVREADGAFALPFEADQPGFERLAQSFARTTGRAQASTPRLAEAARRERPGAFVDWAYGALGALAVEVGVWGPALEFGKTDAVAARYPRALDETLASGVLTDVEGAWARWLDETRGGIGFVDWQSVELDDGVRGVVGGWEPQTRLNPPVDSLSRALQGLELFVLDLVDDLPRLEIELREAARTGGVCSLRVRVKNAGALASGAGGGDAREGVRVTLELPLGARLLAGELDVHLKTLPGQGTSEEIDWLVLLPEGASLRLSASSPWCPVSLRDVKP